MIVFSILFFVLFIQHSMRYDGKQGCSVNYILLRTLNNGKLANNNMEVMDNYYS